MDAPKGRYSVVERDGRLVVIDNQTGAPARPVAPSPARMERPGSALAPIVAGKGPLDSVADFLVAMSAKEFDGQGRAVIAWEWKSNNRTRRWDARLDTAQQRRFGRALVALFAAPLFLFSVFVLSGLAMWTGIVLTLPTLLWGFTSIARLQSETGGISR